MSKSRHTTITLRPATKERLNQLKVWYENQYLIFSYDQLVTVLLNQFAESVENFEFNDNE